MVPDSDTSELISKMDPRYLKKVPEGYRVKSIHFYHLGDRINKYPYKMFKKLFLDSKDVIMEIECIPDVIITNDSLPDMVEDFIFEKQSIPTYTFSYTLYHIDDIILNTK